MCFCILFMNRSNAEPTRPAAASPAPTKEANPIQMATKTAPILYLPTWSRLRIATKQRTRLGSGGDFFEVFQHREGPVTTVMADVAGNGPRAAVPVSDLRWAFRQRLARGEAPGEVLGAVNDWLIGQSVHELLVTALCVRIDVTTGVAEIASAGHLGPFIKRKSGVAETLTPAPALPLGILEGEEYNAIRTVLSLQDRRRHRPAGDVERSSGRARSGAPPDRCAAVARAHLRRAAVNWRRSRSRRHGRRRADARAPAQADAVRAPLAASGVITFLPAWSVGADPPTPFPPTPSPPGSTAVFFRRPLSSAFAGASALATMRSASATRPAAASRP
jgi:hypothetical protein